MLEKVLSEFIAERAETGCAAVCSVYPLAKESKAEVWRVGPQGSLQPDVARRCETERGNSGPASRRESDGVH